MNIILNDDVVLNMLFLNIISFVYISLSEIKHTQFLRYTCK